MEKILPLNLSHCHNRWLGFSLLICLSLIVQRASADAGDTLNVSVGSKLMYDSNVFRLSSIHPQDPKSDQIITSTATLSWNKFYSMQRFEIIGTLIDNRFKNFDFLNFLGKNGSAIWDWYLTPRFHGRFMATHREALNNFADLTGFVNSTTRNLRTDDNVRFEGVFELDGAWRLVGGASYTMRKNSRLTLQDFDNRVLSVEGGIRYERPSGSSLTYKVRSGYGEFFKREQPIQSRLYDTGFDELEHELRLVWPVTGKTSIGARVGHLERHHANFPQRDFSGFVGNVDVNWAPTEKTRVTVGWARDLTNFQTAPDAFINSPIFQQFSSSYASTHRFFFSPVWQITEKTALRLRYDYILRDYLGAVQALSSANRGDSHHSGMIALDWNPLNMLSITGALQRDHRSSNLRGFDFDSAAASISAKLNF